MWGSVRDYFGIVRRLSINSRRLLGMVWGEAGVLVVGLLFLYIGISGVNFWDNWVRGLLINKLVIVAGRGGADQGLVYLVIISGVLMMLPSILGALSHYLFKVYWFFLEQKFELILLAKKAELDVATHEDKANLDLINKINEDGIWRVRSFLDRLMYLLQEIFAVILSAGVIVWSQPWIFLLVCLGTLPELLAEAKQGRRVWGIHSARAEVRRRYWDVRGAFGSLSGLIDLRVFQNSNHFMEMVRQMFVGFQSEEMKNEARATKIRFLVSIGSQGSLIVALVYFVFEVVAGRMEIGTLTFVLASIAGFRNSLSYFFSSLGQQYQDNLFVEDVFRFLDLKPVVSSPERAVRLESSRPPRIEFVGVGFTYPATKKRVMKGFDLVIEPGEKVAIVGVNGAGKTTLIKLLCRFYDPSEGRILLDGVDLKDIDLSSWYERLGIIFQDFSRYHFAVGEGIALGRTDKPMEMDRVRKAGEDSGASAFIKKWEKGYEQMLGVGYSNAVEPSVGQWQKLALSRTFYRDPQVMILDEPTASIDAEAEERIFNRLERVAKDKTVVLISHRFSTVRRADKIVVIKSGRLVEMGSHQELLEKDGVYARLFRLQAKGYK